MGPLTVTELVGPLAVRVQLPDGARIHDVFHVSLVEPFHAPDGSTSRHGVPQPFNWLDGLPTYAADTILDHRLVTVGRLKIVEYLVKMQGDSAEARWLKLGLLALLSSHITLCCCPPTIYLWLALLVLFLI